jgi:phosphoribosylaminoimidazole (AIR) synthetase
MFAVFNMGIGFCAVVGPEDAEAAKTIFNAGGFRAHIIGHATADPTRTVSLPQFGLKGRKKHFRRG